MKSYQAQPVNVQAIQFDGSNQDEIMDFMDGHDGPEGVSFFMGDEIFNSSRDGMIVGGVGDYVIKDSDGDIFLCGSDAFKRIYDEVSDEQTTKTN